MLQYFKTNQLIADKPLNINYHCNQTHQIKSIRVTQNRNLKVDETCKSNEEENEKTC